MFTGTERFWSGDNEPEDAAFEDQLVRWTDNLVKAVGNHWMRGAQDLPIDEITFNEPIFSVCICY